MQRLLSRKFLLSVLASVVVAFGQELGIDLDPEQIITLGGIIAAYVTGESLIDKSRVQALVNAEVEQFKVQANSYIAALNKKLQEVKAADAEA